MAPMPSVSSRFAELMAMSAAQTQDSIAATNQILEEKRRKEEQRKKEQLEKERRERDLHARLIKKRMEEEKRAEERKIKQEEERRRKEEFIRQREEEQRRNLIYGKERRTGGSSSGGGRSRKSQNGSDDDDEAGGLVLTREEKRQRRLLSDLNKSFSSARKGNASPASQGSRKANRAFINADVLESPSSRSTEPRHAQQGSSINAPDNILAVRKQLASSSATLVKLGTTKRDLRTIDEIVTDIHKKKEGRVIDGEEARRNGFDWFGEQKKLKTKAASLPSLSPSPEPGSSQSPRSHSKDRTLASKSSSSTLSRSTVLASQAPERKEPRTKVTIIKPTIPSSLSFSKTSKGNVAPAKSLTPASKLAGSQASRNTASNGKSPGPPIKRRARSDSLSDSDDSMDDSPPPSKRRATASSSRNSISSEIWKLFGKDRNQYVRNDVYSDEDDDMEADCDALRREELRSEKIAKKEDELALEEERRHEEEKRKKKKERERKGY